MADCLPAMGFGDGSKIPLYRVAEAALDFGGVSVLGPISLDVHAGVMLGIIGPNGSGNRPWCGFWPASKAFGWIDPAREPPAGRFWR